MRFRSLCLLLVLCAACQRETPPKLGTFSVSLRVVSEDGAPLEGAEVDWSGGAVYTRAQGTVELPALLGPEAIIVRAASHLSEPVLVGWEDAKQEVPVRLLRAAGADGSARVALHFGGDVMFGRRYEEPTEGSPLIVADAPEQGATRVVQNVVRLFNLADLSVVNLETTVTERADGDAYPGKRFLLRSPPGSLAALLTMGVDVVSLANNHLRDWLDPGLDDTLAALDALGLARLGAGPFADLANRPLVAEVKGSRLGLLSYTSVTGSFVNDNYPRDSVEPPAALAAQDAWIYEPREWGYDAPEWSMPFASRRIGEVWALFAKAEPALDTDQRAAAWAALVTVYPELQDWVARRGHGGGASWSTAASGEAIAALKTESDLVIVQLHSGYQFQFAPSLTVRDAAHAAIDAGADIVVAHHPHVLQGLEWYKGRLVVYSLGNFVFDQDFLATFPSVFLRAVFQGDQLIEARLVPLELDGYRPTPIVGDAARAVFRRMEESSVLPGKTDRDLVSGAVHLFTEAKSADTVLPQIVREHGTARLTKTELRQQQTISLAPGAITRLPAERLWPATLDVTASGSGTVLVGRDIFGWGHFEDVTADGLTAGGTHWDLNHEDKRTEVGDAANGRGFLRLVRSASNRDVLLARPVARIPLTRHRLHERGDQGAVPLDPDATFSFVFDARMSGRAKAYIRADVFHFDDTNPTEDPSSTALAKAVLPLPTLKGDWHPVELSLDVAAYDGAQEANMIMLYIGLEPPSGTEAVLDIDNLAFVEWRDATVMPLYYGAFTHAKTQGEAVTLSVTTLGM